MLCDRRVQNSARHAVYYNFLKSHIPPDSNNPSGFALSELDEAQKWLLMVTVDEFCDQEIAAPGPFIEWLERWNFAASAFEKGYQFITENPDSIEHEILAEAWTKFRAAMS